MNRSTVQPFRRNNVHWRDQCFPLWLKFENNFEDSSRSLINQGKVGTQSIQKTTGLNPDVIPTELRRIDYPIFDISYYINAPASAYFRGEHLVVTGASPDAVVGPMLGASAGSDSMYITDQSSLQAGDMVLISSGTDSEEVHTVIGAWPPISAGSSVTVKLSENLYYNHDVGTAVDKVTGTESTLGDSIAISGSGLDVPNANSFDFSNDFTIEFNAKIQRHS